MDAYVFDRPFRLKILALCLSDSWMSRYGNFIIQPGYFDQEDEEAVAGAILNYRERFGRSPVDPVDLLELIDVKQDCRKLVTAIYKGRDAWDLDLASQLSLTFAKQQAAKLAILESVDDINKGDLAAPIERMRAALDVGEDILSPGMDPVRDISDWLYDIWTDKISTGWYHVDQQLQGGLDRGDEMGIILGPMNRGKTMALINIGYGAATIGSGKNVVHFSHEMSARKICKRYAARMVFRFPQVGDNLEDYAEEVVSQARKLLVGKIRVVDGRGMTHLNLEHHLQRLDAEDFHADVILDDYIDKIPPIRRWSDRRFELSELYTWFRGLAPRYNAAMWSASQSGRDSFGKEIIGMEDVAEDIGKAAIVDVIIALCQTRQEEKANQCRLYLAKVRDGDSHAMIQAKYYKAQQAIVTCGFANDKSIEQDV